MAGQSVNLRMVVCKCTHDFDNEKGPEDSSTVMQQTVPKGVLVPHFHIIFVKKKSSSPRGFELLCWSWKNFPTTVSKFFSLVATCLRRSCRPERSAPFSG